MTANDNYTKYANTNKHVQQVHKHKQTQKQQHLNPKERGSSLPAKLTNDNSNSMPIEQQYITQTHTHTNNPPQTEESSPETCATKLQLNTLIATRYNTQIHTNNTIALLHVISVQECNQ